MSITGFWIFLYYALKKSVTLEASSGVLVEAGQQDELAVRPGTDQSSKAAFGKSAFAKTCSNVLSSVKDMTGAHQSSKKQKYFRAHFGRCNEQNAFY